MPTVVDYINPVEKNVTVLNAYLYSMGLYLFSYY